MDRRIRRSARRATSAVPRAYLTLKQQYGGTALPANFTYVPEGYLGVDSDNGRALVANAGQYNLDLADTAQASGNRRGAAERTIVQVRCGEQSGATSASASKPSRSSPMRENNGSFVASAAGDNLFACCECSHRILSFRRFASRRPAMDSIANLLRRSRVVVL